MMYKCKNCGQIYREKMEYCDCGNNIFVTVNSEDTDMTLKNTDDTNGVDDVIDNLYSQQYYENADFSSEQQYQEGFGIAKDAEDNSKVIFIIAVIIFILSLSFSLILVLKAIKKPSEKKVSVSKPVKTKEQIPDIDTFWVTKTIDTNSAFQNQNINNIKENAVKNGTKNDVVNKTKKDSVVIQTNNIISKSSNKIKKPVIKSNNNKSVSKKADIVAKNSTSTEKKQTTVSNPSDVETTSKKDKYIEKNEESQPKNTNSVKELSSYKNSLRQRLFSYFPILTVSGVGSAQIGFSIDKNGKLINRRFVVQSNNKSLNDALYHMLMQVPFFSPPPEAYSGTEIIMKMDYNNGHYSFSFVQ